MAFSDKPARQDESAFWLYFDKKAMAKHSALALARLIHKFSPEETERTRAFINCFNTKYGKRDLKSVRLFDLLADRSATPADEAIKKEVCPDFTDDAYRKLLARLRLKIYESITLDINLSRESLYTNITVQQVRLSKARVTIQILYLLELHKEAIMLINEGIKIARKYYLYNELVYLLVRKNAIQGRKKNMKETTALETEISKAMTLRNTTEFVEYQYSNAVNLEKTNNSSRDYLKVINAKLLLLENLPMIKDSPPAHYHFQVMHIVAARLRGDYETFESLSRKLMLFIKAHPTLQNRGRMANVYTQLMDAAAVNYKFDHAEKICGQIKKILKPYSRNLRDLKAFEFFLFFYNGKIIKAKESLAALDPDPEDAAFLNKLHYHQAYISFAERDHITCNRLLLQVKAEEINKDVWDFSIRLLQAMIRMEQESFDEAAAIIEIMVRKAKAKDLSQKLRKRELLILHILQALARCGFNYAAVFREERQTLKALFGEENETKWLFFSHELLPFERWLKAIAEKRAWTVPELVKK